MGQFSVSVNNQSLEQIASDLELAETSTLRRIQRLLALPVELHQLIIWGREPGYLGFSVASEIVRLKNAQDVNTLAIAAMQFDFSKEEARAIIQRVSRSSLQLDQAIAEISKLRPESERQYLYAGQIAKGAVGDITYDQIRDRLRKGLAKLVGAQEVLSVAAKEGRFSFLLTERGAKNPAIASDLTSARVDNLVSSLLAAQ